MSFLAELKRRKVFRVAVVYAATGFVVLQATDLILPRLGVPDWGMSLIVVLLLLGFPIALVLGWALELTPDGLRVTPAAPALGPGETAPPPALLGRRTVVVAGLLVAAGIGLGAGLVLNPAPAPPAAGSVEGVDSLDTGADKSIAVLPFADFSPGGDQEWFSDGLAEEILNALARLPDLRVASRTGSFQFRGHAGDVRAIAASLGVAHILQGSVRRTGERVRITAQLVRASDNVHLWSQSFDRDAADVIRVQEEIAYEIARTMQTALEPEALRRMVAAGTNSVAAYEAYLRGQHLERRAMVEGHYLEALAAFEEARTRDPHFSDAHRKAAEFWLVQMSPALIASDLTDLPYPERERLAQDRLRAAVETATDEVRRMRVEAWRAELQLRLRDALELLQHAAGLQPLDHVLWRDLAMHALRVGDHDLAASASRRAAALVENQAEELSLIANRSHRVDIEGAVEMVERALALDPHSPEVLYDAHRVLLWAGRVREAAELADRFRAVAASSRWVPLVEIRQACAEGRTADAAAVLEALVPAEQLAARWLALMYLGRTAEAVDLIRPMDEAGELFPLRGFLDYTYFDATPLPNLNAALRRQGIARPPAAIPYACRPGHVGATSTAAQD